MTSKTHRQFACALAATLLASVAACSSDNSNTGSSSGSGGSSSAAPAAAAGASAGTEQSVQAYCTAFYADGEKFRQRYENVDPANDPTTALITLLGAPQEAATFFAKLATVAPAEIEPDVTVLQNAMQKVNDNMAGDATNPVKAMLDSVVAGASTKGSEDRVNAYTLTNCGPPPKPSTTPAPSATSTPTASQATPATPKPGQTVLSVPTDGYSVTAMTGDTIAMMASADHQPGVRTYDLSGTKLAENLDAASFDPDCKLAIVHRQDGVTVVFTIKVTDTPAQGLEPAHTTQTLIASDATTMKQLWTSKLGSDSNISSCTTGAVNGNDLQSNIAFTTDGRWGLVTMFLNNVTPRTLNLFTGRLRDVPGIKYGAQIAARRGRLHPRQRLRFGARRPGVPHR